MHETPDGAPPLNKLSIFDAESRTREEHDLFIAVREELRAGIDTEIPESLYYTDTPVPVETDYSEEHITLSESDSEPLSGVLVQVGQFVDNTSLDQTVSVAQQEGRGHFVDERGSLTLIKQDDIDRLAMVDKELPSIFDRSRSQIESIYLSDTNKGEARDPDVEIGKSGIHIHYGQCDRFVFVEGHWEIVLQDLRPDSPTYGKRVCISFDAGHGHQLAMVIPPGIAHTVGVFRGEEGTSARLINFPTREYGKVPPQLRFDFPPKNPMSARVAVRAIEARLDPTRIYSQDRTAFSWMTYARWLAMHEQAEKLEALQQKHCILMPGGTGGLLGSAVKEALSQKGQHAIEAISRNQKPETDCLTFPYDLTHTSVAEIKAWILASGAEHIVLTAAWTDVAPGIALAEFVKKYFYQLEPFKVLGTDPISQINVEVVRNIVEAISELPADERPKLILPTTTFTRFGDVLMQSYYALSKRLAERLANLGIPNHHVIVPFGYPYTIEPPQSPDAKPMTLHKLINRIVLAIEDNSEQVKAFIDDAVDPTNLDNVVNQILSEITNEQTPAYPRGWLSTYALCEIIVEVYAEIAGKEADPLKAKAIQATEGKDFGPTVRQLLGKNFEQNPVYLWMCKVAKQVNAQQGAGTISMDYILDEIVTYSAAYPQLSDITLDQVEQAEYVENLRADIHNVMTRILQARKA